MFISNFTVMFLLICSTFHRNSLRYRKLNEYELQSIFLKGNYFCYLIFIVIELLDDVCCIYFTTLGRLAGAAFDQSPTVHKLAGCSILYIKGR